NIDGEVLVDAIPGWKEKQSSVAKHLLMKFLRKTDDDSPEYSRKVQSTISEKEFINVDTVAMSPNIKTPPFDSIKLENVENELGAPRSVVPVETGIRWIFVHCILCPKLLMSMHLRLMRNGGFFFLIPVIVTLCIIGAPMAFMELALGQYTSRPASTIFARISPISAGVGYAMLIMRFILAISVKTEHRLACLTWEFLGSSIFEKRSVECLSATTKDCYLNNICPPPKVFYLGQCFDLPRLTQEGKLSTETTIILHTRRILYEDFYIDDYNLPIPSVDRVLGNMPTSHKIDGTWLFFTVCFICSQLGVANLSRISGAVVIFSFLGIFLGFLSLLLTGYYRVFDKFIEVLNNDATYLFSLDTWIEATVVSLLLLSVGDGTLHSLGATSSFGNDMARDVIEMIAFNIFAMVLYSILFGMTTVVGLELQYRHHRRIDVPAETLRSLVEENIAKMDFTSPLYYYGASNPRSKAAMTLLVVSLILLSAAEYVLISEDVLILIYHFFPAMLKINSALVRHCVTGLMYIAVSVVYFLSTYTEWIEQSYSVAHIAICATVLWECISVFWNYTTYRLLVNIRTMGSASSPAIVYEQNISVFLHFVWRYAVPAALLAAAVFGILSKTAFIELSWTSITTTFICAFPMLYGIKTMTSCWYGNGVMSSLFRTTEIWGPLSILHKKISEYDEKAARITA
ncbi:hypothetical protein V3C99_010666, partial [Haemonchus contortus]